MTREREDEIQRFKASLETKEKRILELKNVLANPIAVNHSNVQELSQKKRQCDDLEAALADSQRHLAQAQKRLGIAAQKHEKLVNRRLQAKRQIRLFEKRYSELNAKFESLSKEKNAIEAKIGNGEQENEFLRAQLKAAMASHAEGESAWTLKVQELKRAQLAVESLESVIEVQRREIEGLAGKRSQLAELLQKEHEVAMRLEEIADAEARRASEFERNAKRLERQIRFNFNEDSVSVVVERLVPMLREPLRSRVLHIAQQEGVSHDSKFFAILEEVGRGFRSQDTSSEVNKARGEIGDEKARNQRLLAVINSIFGSFQRLLREERSLPSGDAALFEFLSEQCVQLDKLLQEEERVSPEIIATDFLYDGTIEERKETLEKMRRTGWDSQATFDLFAAQIFTNSAQAREIKRVKRIIAEQAATIEKFERLLGCSDLAGAEAALEQIASNMKALKSKNKVLQQQLKERESAQPTGPAADDLEVTISQLESRIQSLEKDLESVIAHSASLQRELEVKTLQISSAENSHHQIVEDCAELQRKHLEEMAQFETIIDERNREIRDLSLQFRQAKADLEQQTDRFEKAMAEMREKLNSRTERFNRDAALLQQKKKNLESQFANKLQAIDRKYHHELQKAIEVQEELKKKLADTVQAMRTQSQDGLELSEKLSSSLTKSEKRNQQMINEVSKLTLEKKELEMELRSLTDQMKREIQILNTQNALKIMNAETQFQHDLTTLRGTFMKERNQFIITVLSEFGDLDRFNADDISETDFHEAVSTIAVKYRTSVCRSRPLSQ
jgi:chromosome segregation ATPase